MQQGDVILFQTVDDGEIEVINGTVSMDGGLQTMAYLCMFGGNEDDSNGSDTALSWWGNIDETEPARMYRSETQNLLRSIPATTSNLLRIDQAVKRDLQVFIDEGIAQELSVSVTMPALNTVAIIINIDGETLKYLENWKASV